MDVGGFFPQSAEDRMGQESPAAPQSSSSGISQEDVSRILKHLDLPLSTELPSPPFSFLTDHIYSLPSPLLLPFRIIPPRQRTDLPAIKARRLAHATRVPLPVELSAESARLRWPLLWERMGGSHLPPPTVEVQEEEAWVKESFLPDKGGAQHVKRLGGFLRGMQEEREMEDVIHAKRAERRLDEVGEEFDSDSDDDGGGGEGARLTAAGTGMIHPRLQPPESQAEVKRAFEKKVLELFIDGLDTIDYDTVDFTDSAEADGLAARDETERYFDDESPSRDASGDGSAQFKSTGGASTGQRYAGSSVSGHGKDDMSLQNGAGEYDY